MCPQVSELDGIFLDMYGTLTTGDRMAVETTCRQIVADTGVALTAHELSIRWGDRFFACLDTFNDERFKNLFDTEAESLVMTMREYGVEVDPRPYVERLTAYWRDPPLQPEAPQFLAEFPLPICIVSNADRDDLDVALRRREVNVAGVVASDEVGCYKPQPRIFEAALNLTGWSRERVIHVGDSLHSDVGGALEAGIRSGWLNRAHRIHDVGTHIPDYEFEDLLGITHLINGR